MISRVVMFSSGVGSAVAAKTMVNRYGKDGVTLLFADVNGEHGDNYRFLREASAWIDCPLVVLNNDGKTIWQVFREGNFLGNSRIDPCSHNLKRKPMRAWLDENCDPKNTIVYLGFDWTEIHRFERSKSYWQPWLVDAPLCWEPVMDKSEAIEWLEQEGIQPPLLTRKGFPHANCGGGCVKAGIKQFKRLLEEFPETFAEWEWNEQQIREHLNKDVSILVDRRNGHRPMPLSALREEVEAGESFQDEDWGGCNCMVPET